MTTEANRPCPRSWGDGYRAGYEQGLRDAVQSLTEHNKQGRDWVHGSLWDTLTRECAARIMALSRENKT